MGLKGKLSCEIEVSSSGDLFHELIASKPHEVPDFSPTHFQGFELHEGEFGTNGSIISWDFTLDGKPCFSKQIVENVDEEKRTASFREIEGDFLKIYKAFTVHLQVTSGDDNIDIVKWTIEYEKLNEDTPHPVKELDFALTFTKSVEDHHLKA